MLRSYIHKLVDAEWKGEQTDIDVCEFIYDSRKTIHVNKALFIAIKGKKRDGHDFIENCYQLGIRTFLVDKSFVNKIFLYPEAAFLIVDNTLASLQELSKLHRHQFSYPIIGITGSNGKTIVKEWLYQLLAHIEPFNEGEGPVKSPKSYNSQLGVPLSLLGMKPHNTIGIFEAGISKLGEMDVLANLIQPTIGVFTNLGAAHQENFHSIEEKLAEKLKLFAAVETLIYNVDEPQVSQYIKEHLPHLRTFTWGTNEAAQLQIKDIQQRDFSTTITAIFNNQTLKLAIPFVDKAYIEDAILCWATLIALNINPLLIQEGAQQLAAVAMRLEFVKGINHCTIVNDTYNSDLNSLKIAIEFLNNQHKQADKSIILSDISHTSLDQNFTSDLLSLIKQPDLKHIICVGPDLISMKSAIESIPAKNIKFYESTNDLVSDFHNIRFENETILLKGARKFKFERILRLLEAQKHRTALEVNLPALAHNMNAYKNMLQGDTKLMAMVKAFAYGSGAYEVAQTLVNAGVDYFTVAYMDEGITLRKQGITLPIMVMSPEVGTYDQMIEWKLEPEIFSLQSLQRFITLATSLQIKHYPIHIKLDTGMHRLGFEPNEIPQVIDIIQKNDCVQIKSTFSHFVGSDSDAYDEFTLEQVRRFKLMSEQLVAAFPYKILRHICNSSAISRFPDYHFDMVRLGIGLHGIDPNPDVQRQLIMPSTLKTIVAQVKTVPKEETVGYSRKGALGRDSKIATVSIGYADGYMRKLGNYNGHMLIHGKPAPVVGNVCMDMCMVDVTDIPEVKAGDEVIIFGPELPTTQLAEWVGTIPYEILTAVSPRVKRVYIND